MASGFTSAIHVKSILVALWLLLLAIPATMSAADFEAGLKAYESGNYSAALQEWQPLAQNGNRDAQFYLGVMYTDGEGVEKNLTEAMKWFRQAADQGSPDAQYNLGLAYSAGSGVPRDSNEALRWFRLAAAQGLADAEFSLGAMYVEGEDVP